MITSAEEKQIDDYLILNKLPLDILLEVRDHMISQIVDIQVRENLSFEQAFFKTKIAWEDEFKMTKYSVFFSEEIPVIFKKIIKANYKRICRKSLMCASISATFTFLFIYIASSQSMFGVFFRIQNFLFFLAPLFLFFVNHKIRKYLKTDYKYRGEIFYSMYQKNLGLMIIGITTVAQVLRYDGKYLYLFFRTDSEVDCLAFLITVIVPFLMQAFVIFGIINFLEHKKTLEKLQNSIEN